MNEKVEDKEQDFKQLQDFLGDADFVSFDESNEPITGVYIGFEFVEDNFNPGKQKVNYLLEIENEQKALSSASKRLARAFIGAKPAIGNFIKITRTGEGFDTQYKVEVSEDIPF